MVSFDQKYIAYPPLFDSWVGFAADGSLCARLTTSLAVSFT